MENRKKAIILDMDETLETGIHSDNDELKMILRPQLDELIIKLKEAKLQNIDIVLCTTAKKQWVNKFFELKSEFKNLFDKLYTRDNEDEWRNYSEQDYPIEYVAKSKNVNIEYMKPVTTFGYDSVLFIDDNKMEAVRLKILFGITQGKLEKDVTYFSTFGFKCNSSHKELNEYIGKNEPGCHLICLAIDKFISKEFKSGLTIVDDEFSKEYKLFSSELAELKKKYVIN